MIDPVNLKCVRERVSYAQDDLIIEARRRLAQIGPAPTLPDPSHAAMLNLGRTAAPPTEPGLIRERRTAEAYATFIRERHGETFVFASRYDGAFIPVFDGFVTGPRGARNVSLKFDALARRAPNVRALEKSLAARLDLTAERRRTASLARWLSAVNTWPPAVNGRQVVGDLARDLNRALTLWVTFGLDEGARPLTTIVDLRESGFTYDFVRDPAVSARLRTLAPAGSLTLLWDQVRVLEF